jgi:hypothetical protein
MDEQKLSALVEAATLARFVSECRTHRTQGWRRVESLKAACAAGIGAEEETRALRLQLTWLTDHAETRRAESEGVRAPLQP